MTTEERNTLDRIDAEAAKLDRDGQNQALGWLMCMAAIRKAEQKGA